MPIKFLSGREEISVEACTGEILLDVARRGGLYINASCGGGGTCGACVVTLKKGRFLKGGEIFEAGKEGSPVEALACKTAFVDGEAEVLIPPTSLMVMSGQIQDDFKLSSCEIRPQTWKIVADLPLPALGESLSDLELIAKALPEALRKYPLSLPLAVLRRLPQSLEEGERKITATVALIAEGLRVVDIEPGDTGSVLLGLALDIGTTTVVGLLIDMQRGVVLGKASLYNQQLIQAEDVASRISLCRQEGKLGEMQRLVVSETINPIVAELCSGARVRERDICRVAVSGNTVMMHLLLGLSPKGIGQIPFQPVIRGMGALSALDIGLAVNDCAVVDLIPAISGYVGGDITSDILVSRFHEEKELSVLVDIGTNGEMAVSRKGEILASATAAGPAFEGAGLHHGMRAAQGAVERVRYVRGSSFVCSVIGGGAAVGICGSAIIDFIAEGYRGGIIGESGRLDIDRLKSEGLFVEIEEKGRRMNACILVAAESSGIEGPVIVTEGDISSLLQAKGAIYAGLKTLLEYLDLVPGDIAKLVLAGGFGRHINIENAISIGMLPDIERNRYEIVGNASLGGAFLSLVGGEVAGEFLAIADMAEVIELNRQKNFQDYYQDALFIPNLQREDFPSAE
ncbi:MAG: DUF4445 domain-containing protein [Planctomycetes bacterium]|nr:DUF4445 domain-containing protein [Planctomycetota bacterium]